MHTRTAVQNKTYMATQQTLVGLADSLQEAWPSIYQNCYTGQAQNDLQTGLKTPDVLQQQSTLENRQGLCKRKHSLPHLQWQPGQSVFWLAVGNAFCPRAGAWGRHGPRRQPALLPLPQPRNPAQAGWSPVAACWAANVLHSSTNAGCGPRYTVECTAVITMLYWHQNTRLALHNSLACHKPVHLPKCHQEHLACKCKDGSARLRMIRPSSALSQKPHVQKV